MTKARLVYLILALVGLTAVFVLSDRGERNDQRASSAPFSQVQAADIRGLKLEQGDKTVELSVKDGEWAIPARSNFPADGGKVRSFLLRLLDVKLSQLVTTDATKFGSLGVSDEEVKKNAVRITITDQQGKELGGIILGNSRKKGEGRFVRQSGGTEVFLLADAPSPDLSTTYWLNSEVVNLLPSQIKNLQQFRSSAEGINREFELAREGTLGKVALVGATAGEGSEAKIEEVLGSYQAIQLTDVIPAGDERAKGLTFDSQSIVKVKNAQVYTLATAAKEGKFYLKVSVGFDQPLAKQLTAEWEKEQSEKQKAAGSAGEGAKEGGETAKKPELPLSNEGEAAELHKKFQSWVYELASFQAEKLRKDRKSLADAPAQSEEQAGEEADEEAGTDVTPGESVRPLGVPTPTE